MKIKELRTSQKAVQGYQTTINVFESLFREMKDLSKKKPDILVSEFKVKQVNRLLTDIKAFLSSEPEAKYLDLLESVTLPQAADVVIVMAQYEGALKAFHERYYGWKGTEQTWFIDES